VPAEEVALAVATTHGLKHCDLRGGLNALSQADLAKILNERECGVNHRKTVGIILQTQQK
jgi:hypothetical protein